MEKGIIFDFDGVIINSNEVQKQALSESYTKVVGDENRPSFEEFFSHSGDSLSNIFKKMNLPLAMVEPYRIFSRQKMELIKVYEGIKELIVRLRDERFKCGLCTGKDRDRTIEILKKLDLFELFDTVVCSDDVSNPKPAPDSLILAIKNIGVRFENVVMVGDSRNDILCAKNAGVKNIAVTWGDVAAEELKKSSPDCIVNTMDELYESLNASTKDRKVLRQYLVNDFVIAEQHCNMKCAYCLTDISKFKEPHKNIPGKSTKIIDYLKDVKLRGNIDNVSKSITESFDVAILKVSGGELFMVKGIVEYLKQQSAKYKVIQVLTNGILLNDIILNELKNIGNVCLQISIDHNTIEGNGYRTNNVKLLKKTLECIDKALKYKIPLEINSVLTDKNTPIINEFADYLLKYKNENIMLFPFPVRGASRDMFYPKSEQLIGIEKLIENYSKYESILAPKVYLEYLFDFLKNGTRKIRCILSGMAVGTFDDGTITACPNYWFTSLGNLLDENRNKTISKIGKDKIYRVLMGRRNRIDECKKCFTPWETLNLYVAGILPLGELCRSPLYSFPGVSEYIVCLKKSINDEINNYDTFMNSLRQVELP